MNLYKKNIHIIGIGGICMSGIANILLKKKCNITGSDISNNYLINNLKKNKNVTIYNNHSKNNINKNIDYIIYSSSIEKNNIEILESKKLKIKIIKRGVILNKIIKEYEFSISVSGTHGKTTTSSIIIHILKENNLNPSFLNGGIIKKINYNSYISNNKKYFIIESDESDKSFLELYPNIIIITNIDNDHIRSYNKNFYNIKKSFLKFIKNTKKNGFIIACYDDINVRNIIKKNIKNKIYTYGYHENSDFVIKKYYQNIKYCFFNIFCKFNKRLIKVKLKNSIGIHNSLNSTAAIILSLKLKIKLKKILKSLNNFYGVINRMDILGKYNIYIKKNKSLIKNILFINDYGHHPNEILNSYKTVKNINNNKIVMIFQPHRFTRTLDLINDFIKVLCYVDFLIILKIYSANENINIIKSYEFFNKLKKVRKKPLFYCKKNKFIGNVITRFINNNDIVLSQGAGNIHKIVIDFLNKKNNFFYIKKYDI